MALLDLMPLVARRLDQAPGNGKAIGDQSNVAMVPNTLIWRVADLQSRIDMDKQRAASQSMTQMASAFNVYVPFDKVVAYQSRMGGGGSQAPAAAPAAAPDVSAPTSAGYTPFKFAAYGRRQA